MAGLHPIESGALLQEGRPQAEKNSPSSSIASSPCEADPVPKKAGLTARQPDYVISDRHLRRLCSQYELLGKRLNIVRTLAYRQPHCPPGGELRSYYLAPQQVKLEAACLREHGVASVGELLDRCLVLLASRSPSRPGRVAQADRADPMLDLALEALRDAQLLCSQMRRIEALP